MIVVFVNGLPRRLWADSKNGSAPVETVFVKELIPDVENNLRSIATREGRILEGFSMGGYGAARQGFRYPELFAGVSILAGGPFDLDLQGPRTKRNPALREFMLREVSNDDAEYFKALSPLTIIDKAAEKIKERKLTIRRAAGEADDSLDLNRKFHDKLTSLKVTHEYAELPKVGHDCLAVFTSLGEKNGAFYRSVLGQPGGPAK
jgi:enterochelin esterase-like enzyme